MTVGELIEELKKHDPSKRVMMEEMDGTHALVEGVATDNAQPMSVLLVLE